MHGSRPDLFQLRQLVLAAVVIAGAIATIAAVILCSGLEGFSLWKKSDSITRFDQIAIDVLP
jgi:hypothetical protein